MDQLPDTNSKSENYLYKCIDCYFYDKTVAQSKHGWQWCNKLRTYTIEDFYCNAYIHNNN